jgi:hypothetical protein
VACLAVGHRSKFVEQQECARKSGSCQQGGSTHVALDGICHTYATPLRDLDARRMLAAHVRLVCMEYLYFLARDVQL